MGKPIIGRKCRMFVGGKEVAFTGSWKMSTVPWYLRWWYAIKLWQVRG